VKAERLDGRPGHVGAGLTGQTGSAINAKQTKKLKPIMII